MRNVLHYRRGLFFRKLISTKKHILQDGQGHRYLDLELSLEDVPWVDLELISIPHLGQVFKVYLQVLSLLYEMYFSWLELPIIAFEFDRYGGITKPTQMKNVINFLYL